MCHLAGFGEILYKRTLSFSSSLGWDDYFTKLRDLEIAPSAASLVI